MVLGTTAGRWRSTTVLRHRQESFRTRTVSRTRSWVSPRSLPPITNVTIVVQRGNWQRRTPPLRSLGGMKDRPHRPYRDHHGQAMPLEEVQGLLLPPSRTGNTFLPLSYLLPSHKVSPFFSHLFNELWAFCLLRIVPPLYRFWKNVLLSFMTRDGFHQIHSLFITTQSNANFTRLNDLIQNLI